MNSNQKEVLQAQLNSEKQTLKELKGIYQQAIEDCSKNIMQLSTRTDLENIQSIVYQQQYQQAIKAQLETALAQLQSNEFATISDYLARCYQDGYVGAMYDIAGQGIPLVIPIDQKAVLQAVQIDSKISKGLYNRLGEDISTLKKSIRAEVSRGIANGSSWNEIGTRISQGMNSTIDMFGFNKAQNNSIRIARTEGHRIQTQSALDAQHAAKKKGADILKQWDATLDGTTRDTHRKLDGQIREIDEDFEVEGMTASAPGMFGDPAEDCNCRCALLQRARWALDEEELETLKERAEYFGLDKSKDFDDYKSKYLEADKVLNAPSINNAKISKAQDDFSNILNNSNGVESHVTRMSMYSEYTEYVENNELAVPFSYSVNDDVIYYNPKAPNFDLYDMNFVQAHELSHRMDILEYRSFENQEFVNAIDICKQKVMENASEIQSWFDEGGKYENDFAISDIISALSLNSIEVPIGHTEDYWNKSDNVALEIFANISSIDVIGNSSKDEFESLLKELYESYKGVVK